MAGLSQPRSVYGVHSVAPYSRADGTYYGIIKVLDSSSLSLSGKQNDLYGGSNKYAYASETGEITSDMSLKVSQMEDFMFFLFLGKAPTVVVNETSGNVSTLKNFKGTSLASGVTGILSIAVTALNKANLKKGRYVVVAKDATHVDIFVGSDVDLNRGLADTYADDSLKLLSGSNILVSSAGADIAALGITITGGSAVAMVPGDTATFYVRPVSTKSSTVVVGSAADIFPEFGAIIVAQKRGSDELFEVNAYRCKGSGMPIGFDTFAWSKADLKAKILYDAAKDGVFETSMIQINP